MNRVSTLFALGAAVLAAFAISAFPALADAGQRKLPAPVISEALAIPLKAVDVLGSRMTYLELGEGEPVLFVHGNPTSSYLWRNVMPHAGDGHRAIAIDLIGMGGSAKPDIPYSFDDHYRYFAAFIDALRLDTVTLVGHDWGAALAWEYARRNPTRVRRLAFMEGVLPPAFPAPSFEAMGPDMEKMFRAFKDPVLGPRVVMDEHMFVEQILPGFVNRTLGDEAMRAYRAPFLAREARRPVLAWPREVPIAGEPASTMAALNAISAFMATTKMPVLLVYAEPGAVVPPSAVAWYVKRIANLETSFVGQGLHYIQEDQPDAIGRAIADWMRRN
jgi:haloalkane dehalogenase